MFDRSQRPSTGGASLGRRMWASVAALVEGSAVWWVMAVLSAATVLSFGTYWVPLSLTWLHGLQSLRAKYGAEWAVVTGGSSGIGLALVKRLAADGVNCVVVAFKDKAYDECTESLPKEFPGRQFRFVAANLAEKDESRYLEPIVAATRDIPVQILFANAGYIKTGLFDLSPLQAQLSNLHCNVTHAVVLTHHFLTRMRNEKLRGCVCFTSSPAYLTPCPLSAMYGATKAFLTEFAVSIAPEVVEFGIDVAVVVRGVPSSFGVDKG